MVKSMFLLLPCLVSLAWALSLLFQRDKDHKLRCLMYTAVLTCVYFFIDANYVNPEDSYKSLVYLDILSQFITLALFPMVVMYLFSLEDRQFTPMVNLLMFFPCVVLGCAATVIYLKIGFDKATEYIIAFDSFGGRPPGFEDSIYRIHDLFTMVIYNVALACWIAAIWFFLVQKMTRNGFRLSQVRTLLKERVIVSTLNIVCFLLILFLFVCMVRVVLGRQFLLVHDFINCFLSLLLAVILSQMFYISYWFQGGKVRYVLIGKDAERMKVGIKPGTTVMPLKYGQGSLHDRFHKYMDEEKPYLNPDFSIDDAAMELSTTRKYLSEMMDTELNCTFKSYINSLRVEEAKRLMLEKPDDHLEVVARASGFTSDSQLVKKFNEVAGEPPRAWLKNQSGI